MCVLRYGLCVALITLTAVPAAAEELETSTIGGFVHYYTATDTHTTVGDSTYGITVGGGSQSWTFTPGEQLTVRFQPLPERKLAVQRAPDGYTQQLMDFVARYDAGGYYPEKLAATVDQIDFEGLVGVAPTLADSPFPPVRVAPNLGYIEVAPRFVVTGSCEFTALTITFTLPSATTAHTGSYSRYTAVGASATGPAGLPDFTLLRIKDARPVEVRIDALIALVDAFNLQQGIDSALDAKLDAALAAITAASAGDRADAANHLRAFVASVEAQIDKKLTATQAQMLIDAASDIMVDLEV